MMLFGNSALSCFNKQAERTAAGRLACPALALQVLLPSVTFDPASSAVVDIPVAPPDAADDGRYSVIEAIIKVRPVSGSVFAALPEGERRCLFSAMSSEVTRADAVDENFLNHVIWYSATDWKRPYPGETEILMPDSFVKAAAEKAHDDDDDDDDDQDEKLRKAAAALKRPATRMININPDHR
jgi:hypothetical protein